MSRNGKRKDPNERVRKIGQREEIINVKLTQVQLDEMRYEVMLLLDDEERIEEKAKEAAKNFSSQLKTNQLQRNEIRRVVTAGVRRQTIIVEEHLTASNEVIRIRQDTGDQLGLGRTATPRELQEELPLDPKPADDEAESEEDESETSELEVTGESAFGAEPQ